MRGTIRRSLALLAAVTVTWTALPAHAAPATGRIEGLVIGLDGRPAADYRVHLIDTAGSQAAQAVTDAGGSYSLPDVAAGEYALALESPEGQVAPVSTPVRIGRGELRRHDLKLLEAEPEERDAATASSGGLGAWWAGLSTAAKVWVIVGSVAVVGVTYAALTDDDDEQTASPSGSE